jgi:hypothetical protein
MASITNTTLDNNGSLQGVSRVVFTHLILFVDRKEIFGATTLLWKHVQYARLIFTNCNAACVLLRHDAKLECKDTLRSARGDIAIDRRVNNIQ